MSALSLTYTITNGTLEDAAQVQQNFTDGKNYINASVMRIDGANDMTAALGTNDADPTLSKHAVRKGYQDGAVVLATGATAQVWPQDTYQNVIFATEVRDKTNGGDAATNFNLATSVFTVPKTGVYLMSAAMFDGLANSTAFWQTRFHVTGGTAIDLTGPTVEPSSSHPFIDPIWPFSVAWYLTAGQTVEPQVKTNASSNPTKSLGKWLSIVWLHG